ncbi:LysR family transcriptional regulator [Phenylobacterium sp.]|uniref:LysR family transcriptional regulator n=1 Tax=Phenylobacterium sp. TaxID=1871053 RepID=UPI0035ADA1BF
MTLSIQDVDLKLLRMFRTIVQCGGFSLAQARLNISQSTISTQMSKLETRLGVRLCERGHGRFRLTPEGERVLAATQKMLASIDDFHSELAETKGEPRGELRIGLLDNMVTNPLSPLSRVLAELAVEAPGIHFNLTIGGVADLGEKVLDSRLHLAIAFSYRPIEGLSYIPLFSEEHRLYCGRAHPLFRRPPGEITVDEVKQYEFAGWGEVQFGEENRPPIEVEETASSPFMEGLTYLILSGRYLAYLPSHYAQRWEECGQMRAVLPEIAASKAQFFLMTRDSAHHPQMVRCVVDKLLEHAPRTRKVRPPNYMVSHSREREVEFDSL